MKIDTYEGYEICLSQGHGKAVKGTKKTATVQVCKRLDSSHVLLKKQFSYQVISLHSRAEAIEKAYNWIRQQQINSKQHE